MHRILFVSFEQGYLRRSLYDYLREQGHDILLVHGNADEVDKITEEIDLVIIFADESILTKGIELIHLKEKIADWKAGLFALGTEDEMRTLETLIPKKMISHVFFRPVSNLEVHKEVEKYYTNAKKQVKKNVLVVDDSGVVLRNVKEWLEENYVVTLANSGENAMKQLSRSIPDLMLLDYDMPEVNGVEVLERMRGNPRFAKVPVFFLTSRNDKEAVVNVIRLKPEGYILKSSGYDQLLEVVDEFFYKQMEHQ